MIPRPAVPFLFGFLLFLCVPVSTNAQEEEAWSKIARANELYHEKDYATAAEIYESIVRGGLENGYLYYNLGNTYMRLGQTGRAILNYLRAQALIPREESLEANLRYAVRQTVDQVGQPEEGWISTILFWTRSLNLAEHLQLLIVANIVFWFVSIGWMFYRKTTWELFRKSAFILLLLVIVSTGTKYFAQEREITGVVLEKKIDIKSDKGSLNVTLFQLHKGAIVSVTGKDGGWVRVSLGLDKSGWTPENTVGLIKKTGT